MAITLRRVKGAPLTWDEHDDTHLQLSTGAGMSTDFHTPGNITADGDMSGANLSGTNTGDQDLSGLVPTSRTINGQALTGDVTITETFLGLTDTPNDYSAQAGKVVTVNGTEDGVEFTTPSSGLASVPICIYESDQSLALAVGTLLTLPGCPAGTFSNVRCAVITASSSGKPEFDIKVGGVSIFTTRPTIDVGETDSSTAAIAAVINDGSVADASTVTFHCVTAGTGTVGWIIYADWTPG